MSRIGRTAFTLAALCAAGVEGYWAGARGVALPGLHWLKAHGFHADAQSQTAPPPTGAVSYDRDPDCRPEYADAPKKTPGGKDYVPVHVSEDVSFDAPPTSAALALAPSPGGELKKLLYYRNPMGLPDTSPVPKKDSMGMDYIAVYAGDNDDSGGVKLSPGKLQRTGVRSEPAQMRAVTTPVRGAGTVQLDEQRQAVIALRFDAYIDDVENITTGSVVHEGQPLMHVYGPDLLQPAAQFLSALNDHSDPNTMKSSRRRLENLGVPESIIATIQKNHEIPATFAWPAPRGGIVIDRAAIEGMKATAGEPLFRVADLSVVWVLADIPEVDLPSIAIGQAVVVKPRGAARTFEGRVQLVYPSINKETRTARLRIELPNPDAALLPNMYADVTIATGDPSPVLTVPDSAVIDSGDRRIAILDKGDGKFEPRPVKTGRRGGGFVEITDGLADGDRVVVAANFLIDAESNLKAALQGLTSNGEAK